MDFHALLDKLQNPGDDGLPDDIYDNIRGAYNDLSDKAEAGAAKIDSLVSENDGLRNTIDGLNGTVSDLKAKSYDLMTRVGADIKERGEESADEQTGGIDDFFNGK